MAAPKEISSTKQFGGFNKRYEHESSTIGVPMKFTVYFPPAAEKGKVPVLYWLSGLTCTDENVIQKSGVQRDAAEKGVAIVACDTSPRGLNVEGEADSWDFGVGAGFYLNATEDKWKAWRMYDYVVKELPELLRTHFPQLDTSNASIFGHSMGGHGALTIFLKNRDKYKTVSAFAPICHPSNCPWGVKAFTGYLGSDKSKWEEYDATVLAQKFSGNKDFHILIDQGSQDNFLHQKQLLPEEFAEACKSNGIGVKLRMQDGYDHSYYTIATFMPDHITHHVKALTSS
ncbi:S-formylglutathione hydrolase [Klebsormidium nitens]|uniref:S-formylglutathione hydrolase n=1 Tax=Klebsormidium nitens TaxID=105231 RepID=A0A1Y1HW11_KLENI|nr:S-formylglutathione hydrolase [Klebsormidium nitens]|eukprot:GAQ82353.1 S-formylglutathione hydrolase [Klebsormidium nitens]